MGKTTAILAAVVVGTCFGAVAAPRISVDLSSCNFPDTVEGIAVVHTFLLTNTGDEELVIADVKVTCGCTTTALEFDRLAPGQTVGLTATVNTEGFLNWIEKTISVTSNDPERQSPNELRLTMAGNVLERLPYQYSVPRLFEMAYVLLDVRDPAAYAVGHLAGAMNLPAGEIAAHAAGLPAGVLTIFYDQSGEPATLEAVTQALHEGGVASVYALQGGLDAWRANYDSTRIVTGADAPWSFLEAAGTPDSSAPGVRTYDVGRLLTDYVLVDIRPTSEFAAGHLAGALNLEGSALTELVQSLPTEVLVVICSDDGADSDRVVQELWTLGVRPRSLLGGLAEWRTQHGELLLIASAS
jgi:rhodanese-related sulfurtransferase